MLRRVPFLAAILACHVEQGEVSIADTDTGTSTGSSTTFGPASTTVAVCRVELSA